MGALISIRLGSSIASSFSSSTWLAKRQVASSLLVSTTCPPTALEKTVGSTIFSSGFDVSGTRLMNSVVSTIFSTGFWRIRHPTDPYQ
eukprot:4787377-Amphidinium_carterae.1